MSQYNLTDKEFYEAFYFLKTKKTPWWDEITVVFLYFIKAIKTYFSTIN